MTNFFDGWQQVATDIAASPKTTAVVASGTSALGISAAMDLIHGTLAVLAVGAGILASLALARYHLTNERNMRLQNKLLEQQLRDKGLDPAED